MAKQYGFSKKERLKSRKVIDDLFVSGKGFTIFPLRVTYKYETETRSPGIEAAISVSKRHFKKAVDRNRIKRLLREAYRLQKNELVKTANQEGKKGYVFFMYTDKEMPSYDVIKQAMDHCIKKLGQRAILNEKTI
jgi:ribonuclease P protein component